ncbi:MAG TPA: PPC domain-containing DNA-binding protein [Streptosporangiaceae bacterium]|nr:PPC domain-containing DNA-binding protein [Streptosporangiaceae bacterium]
MNVLAERIEDGRDLRLEIERITQQHRITAGSILCGIGGLRKCRIRAAVIDPGAPKYIDPGIVEIVALQGTLSMHSAHVHIAVSDRTGRTWGGHLSSGCIVRMTCELVIMRHDAYTFDRALDARTGYDELVITQHDAHEPAWSPSGEERVRQRRQPG